MKFSRLGVHLLSILCLLSLVSLKAERPNILFIYSDDQAAWTTGASGNNEAHTPNMDRLAKEGARLVNSFVVTPVCSPSRAELLTSRYGSELGITEWINPRSERELGLAAKWPTWPAALREAGYKTGLVGKWHLGVGERHHPRHFGYDHFMGFREGGTRTKDPTLERDGEQVKFEGLTVDILTDHAIEFLRRPREGPFLLSLHYRAPHGAYLPVAPEDWARVEGREISLPDPGFPDLREDFVRRKLREYYASVAGIDRNLGRVLAELEALGLAENTLVVFTSDHGYNLGHHGIHSKGNALWRTDPLPPKRWPHITRQRRPNLFDTSLRVPTFVRWPGKVPPGTVVERTVTNLDWFPTLLAAAGVEQPEEAKPRGKNILPQLRGEGWDKPEPPLYLEYAMHHGSRADMRGIRTPSWKYMRDFLNEGRVELYDLSTDPGETTNLAESDTLEHTAARERMERLLAEAMAEVEAGEG